ncbi:MAG: hypothetical protein ACXWIZ_14845, partial [Caldimonas sp.]
MAGAERELELAFEDARIGVEELHLHAGFGDAARDLDVDSQRLQADRLVRAGDYQRRRSPRGRHELGLRLGQRAGGQAGEEADKDIASGGASGHG